MKAPRHDSRRWTGEIDAPPDPLPQLVGDEASAGTTAEQADGRVVLAAFGTLLLLLTSGKLSNTLGPGYALDDPLIPAVGAIVTVLALIVARRLRQRRERLARLVLRAGVIAGLGMAAANLLFSIWVAGGLQPGPIGRAQVVEVGKRRIGHDLVLQSADGAMIDIHRSGEAPYGEQSRCYDVRRWSDRHGHNRVELLAGSPLPATGGLAWPVDRADCFSAKPIDQIGTAAAR